MPDRCEPHLAEIGDLLVAEAQAMDRKGIEHALQHFRHHDLAAGEMAHRPGCTDGWCDGTGHAIAQITQALEQQAQHFCFAPEQVINPGNIKHQIAESAHVAQYRYQRAGIGMPIGKGGESRDQ